VSTAAVMLEDAALDATVNGQGDVSFNLAEQPPA